jgi:hypothetical protein
MMAIHTRLVTLPRDPDNADHSNLFEILKEDLRLVNNAATLIEYALLELSLRKSYYNIKQHGLLPDGLWVAIASGGPILAVGDSKDEVVRTADQKGHHHFIVRHVGSEDE